MHFMQNAPEVDDGFLLMMNQVPSGDFVAFLVVHPGTGGEQIPEIIVAPEAEGDCVIDIEIAGQRFVGPDAKALRQLQKDFAGLLNPALGCGQDQKPVDHFAGA
jgi:hypothetical protein